MEIKKVEGIIVSERPYSESSKIVNVLTRDLGVIGVMCKGARRIKGNLMGVTGKFTYGIFNIYYKEGKLSTLISVDILDSFKNIQQDISKISYVAFITELVNQVIKDIYLEEIYDVYINSIKKINEGFNEVVITNIFELKMLDYLGVKPVIDECCVCGSKNIITASSDKGGFVCSKCSDNNDKHMSDKSIKLIRMFYYVDIAKISKLDISDEVRKEIDEFINDYYDRYTGLYLKTKSFLDNLKKV